MTIKEKLQNPFALVAQGFVAGAILLWATAPSDEAPQSPPTAESASTTADRHA